MQKTRVPVTIAAITTTTPMPTMAQRKASIFLAKITMQRENKAGYTATLVACGWAGAVLEKVTKASGQERYAQKA